MVEPPKKSSYLGPPVNMERQRLVAPPPTPTVASGISGDASTALPGMVDEGAGEEKEGNREEGVEEVAKWSGREKASHFWDSGEEEEGEEESMFCF